MNGMDEFLALFGGVRLADVIQFLIAIGFVILVVKKAQEYMSKKLEDVAETKKNTGKIMEMTERIPEIETKVNILEANQMDIKARVDNIESENKRREASALRERLLNSYKYYTNPEHNPLGQITKLEHQAWIDVYEEYIEAGGDGMLHAVVKPEFDKLVVIDINDTEAVQKLMQSRK